MIDFKRKRRAYLMPVLQLIRRVLNVLKKFAYPDHIIPKSVYQIYVEDQNYQCFLHFKELLKSTLLLTTKKIREYAIKESIKNDSNSDYTYLEFGVFSGTTITFFSKYLTKNKIYGFDSFEGLKEHWLGTTVTKGTFDLKKKIPTLPKNVVPVAGWIQDTLPPFLNEKKPKINFVHIDVDTYETTKFILDLIKPQLVKGAIILFDELYNFEGWDVGEYKALTEVYAKNEYKFEAFAHDGRQALIKILN